VAGREIAGVLEALTGGRKQVEVALTLLSLPPSLTDNVATRLAKLELDSTRSCESLVVSLHFTESTVSFDQEWRLDEDLRNELLSRRSKLNGHEVQAHKLLLDIRSKFLEDVDVGPLPRYLISNPGYCFHTTELDANQGLACYRQTWKPENSPDQWLLGALAEEQQEQGTIPSWAIEPSFFRAMNMELAGDWQMAETYFEQVVDTDIVDLYVGVASHHLGIIKFKKHGDLDRARQLLEKAIEVASLIGDSKLQAFALNTLGGVLRAKKDYAAAIQALQKSVDLGHRLDLMEHQAQSYNSLGAALRAIGEDEEARVAFEKSLEYGEILGDRQHLIHVFTSLGSLERRYGSLDEAVQMLKEAQSLAEIEGRPRLLAVVLNALGSAYRSQGKLSAATECLVESLRIGHQLNDKRHLSHVLRSLEQLGEELLTLGLSLRRSGDLNQAVSSLSEAAEVFKKLNESETLVRTLNTLAAVKRAGGDLEGALVVIERALRLAKREQISKSIAHLLVTKASISRDAGEYDKAKTALEEAIKRAVLLEDHRQVSIGRYNLAEVWRELGREEEAALQISLGMDAALKSRAPDLEEQFGRLASEFCTELLLFAKVADSAGNDRDTHEALKAVASLVERVTDIASEIRLRTTLAALLRRQKKLEEAEAQLQIALSLAKASDDIELEVLVENTRATLLRDQGKHGLSVELLARMRTIATSNNLLKQFVFLSNTLASVLEEVGDLNGAARILKEAVVAASDLDNQKLVDQSLRSFLSLANNLTTSGAELRREGEIEEAERVLFGIVQLLREIHFTEARGYAENTLAALKRQQGRVEEAKAIIEKTLQDLEQSPGHRLNNRLRAHLLNTLAAAGRDSGDFEDAVADGIRGLKAASTVADERLEISVRMTLASIYRRTRSWGDVIRQLRSIRTLSEREGVRLDISLLRGMAQFRKELGDLDAAATDLREAAQQAERRGVARPGEIWFDLALVRKEDGRLVDSLKALEEAEASQDVLSRPRSHFKILNTKAAVLRDLNQLPLALEVVRKAIKSAERSQDKNSVAVGLNTLATIQRDMVNFEDALQAYEKIVSMCRSDSSISSIDVGSINVSRKSIAKVVRRIHDRPQGADGVLAKYFRGLGQALARSGERHLAKHSLSRSLSYGLSKRAERSARATLANVLFRLGEHEEAIAEYEQVFELGWDDSRLRGSYAESLYKAGRAFSHAEEQYKKSIAIDAEQENAFVRTWYALALASQEGREEDAQKLALEGVKIQPEHAAVLTNYARVLILLGGRHRIKLAREALNKAIDTAPEGFHWPWTVLLDLPDSV